MNKENLKNFLDTIYELEGLVHLAIVRDDCPPELLSLIDRKGREVGSMCAGEGEETAASASVASFPEEEASSLGEEMEEYSLESGPEEETAGEAEMPEILEPEPYVEPEPPLEPESSVEPELMAEPDPVAVPMPKGEPRGRLVFSINDRYRFRRELFGNSDSDFNEALVLVASMESYDEAEDYFTGDLQWDPKRQEVTDFLEIVKSYFKE